MGRRLAQGAGASKRPGIARGRTRRQRAGRWPRTARGLRERAAAGAGPRPRRRRRAWRATAIVWCQKRRRASMSDEARTRRRACGRAGRARGGASSTTMAASGRSSRKAACAACEPGQEAERGEGGEQEAGRRRRGERRRRSWMPAMRSALRRGEELDALGRRRVPAGAEQHVVRHAEGAGAGERPDDDVQHPVPEAVEAGGGEDAKQGRARADRAGRGAAPSWPPAAPASIAPGAGIVNAP